MPLSDKDELWKLTIESMRDAVVILDVNKKIIFVNSCLEKLLQKTRSELQGKSFTSFFSCVSTDGSCAINSQIDKMLNKGSLSCCVHDELLKTQTGEIPVSMQGSLINRTDQTIAGALIIIHDLTETYKTEKAKKYFIAGISHELYTPLTSIKAAVGTILRDKKISNKVRKNFLDIINEESSRMLHLVSNLTEMSQIDSGLGKCRKKNFDCIKTLNRTVMLFIPFADKKNIKLNVVQGLDHCIVNADEDKIESVFTNLISNAIKYTDFDGVVDVEIYLNGENVIFIIRDTGCGIVEEEKEKIFDRFYRSPANGIHSEGMGIGLTLVRDILDMHGGTIKLDSTSSKGSVFKVELPLV